jgi:DHA2 family multidrug resistance protein-like MFS transporter
VTTLHPGAADGTTPVRARRLALAVVCLATMMTFVNVSSTIGALAAIQADLRASATEVVWITSAYSLVVATLILAAGTLADLLGRRRVLMLGSLVFAAGSLAAYAAGSAGTLIAAQGVMGAGGAMVLPAGLAIVSHLFATPRERTEAVSVWAGSSGLGLAVGPVGAGLLVEQASWNAVFLVNVVLGLGALAGAAALVPESRQPGRRLDPGGIVLATLAIGSLTFAIIEGRSLGPASPIILATYAVAVVALVAFIRHELRHPDPMMDVRLFASPSFSTVMAVAGVTMFGFTGTALLTVLYLQHVQGVSALGAGLRVLAMCVPFILISPLAARLVRRVGFTRLLGTGLVVMSVGIALLLLALPEPGFGRIWPGLVVTGIGSGLLVAPSTAAAVVSVPQAQAGMASSAVNMFRQLGNVLGASVLGTVLTSQFASGLTDRLAVAGLPPEAAAAATRGAERGGEGADLPAGLAAVVQDAVHRAFTDAFHAGVLVAALVVALAVVPTLVLVRHRPPPHQT